MAGAMSRFAIRGRTNPFAISRPDAMKDSPVNYWHFRKCRAADKRHAGCVSDLVAAAGSPGTLAKTRY